MVLVKARTADRSGRGQRGKLSDRVTQRSMLFNHVLPYRPFFKNTLKLKKLTPDVFSGLAGSSTFSYFLPVLGRASVEAGPQAS